MKIKIKDRDVELKQTLRSAIMYENIQGKSPENIDGITDMVVYIYCVVIGSDKTLDITLDEFIDYIDVHPEVINDFSLWIAEINAVTTQLSADIEKAGGNKGKKSKN